jgi:hypothetical protein
LGKHPDAFRIKPLFPEPFSWIEAVSGSMANARWPIMGPGLAVIDEVNRAAAHLAPVAEVVPTVGAGEREAPDGYS